MTQKQQIKDLWEELGDDYDRALIELENIYTGFVESSVNETLRPAQRGNHHQTYEVLRRMLGITWDMANGGKRKSDI